MEILVRPRFKIGIPKLEGLTVKYIAIDNARYHAASPEQMKESPEDFIINPSEDQKEYLIEKLRDYLAITKIRATKINPRTKRYHPVTTLPVIVLQHLHGEGFSRETNTTIMPEKGFRISEFAYIPEELLEKRGYRVEEHNHPGLRHLAQIRSCRLFFGEGEERKTELYMLHNIHNCPKYSWNNAWSEYIKELT